MNEHTAEMDMMNIVVSRTANNEVNMPQHYFLYQCYMQ